MTTYDQHQRGNNIEWEALRDNSGYSVSMPDANTIAIGAYLNRYEYGHDKGYVRIYEWSKSIYSI